LLIFFGNLKTKIDLKDSLPIKQVPHRVLLQMRGEIDGIIQDMKAKGVIEESQSPWISSAVRKKKAR